MSSELNDLIENMCCGWPPTPRRMCVWVSMWCHCMCMVVFLWAYSLLCTTCVTVGIQYVANWKDLFSHYIINGFCLLKQHLEKTCLMIETHERHRMKHILDMMRSSNYGTLKPFCTPPYEGVLGWACQDLGHCLWKMTSWQWGVNWVSFFHMNLSKLNKCVDIK